MATGHVMPDKWAKPVVESVILPSHAQVSPGTGPGGPVPINVPLQTAFTVDGNSLND